MPTAQAAVVIIRFTTRPNKPVLHVANCLKRLCSVTVRELSDLSLLALLTGLADTHVQWKWKGIGSKCTSGPLHLRALTHLWDVDTSRTTCTRIWSIEAFGSTKRICEWSSLNPDTEKARRKGDRRRWLIT